MYKLYASVVVSAMLFAAVAEDKGLHPAVGGGEESVVVGEMETQESGVGGGEQGSAAVPEIAPHTVSLFYNHEGQTRRAIFEKMVADTIYAKIINDDGTMTDRRVHKSTFSQIQLPNGTSVDLSRSNVAGPDYGAAGGVECDTIRIKGGFGTKYYYQKKGLKTGSDFRHIIKGHPAALSTFNGSRAMHVGGIWLAVPGTFMIGFSAGLLPFSDNEALPVLMGVGAGMKVVGWTLVFGGTGLLRKSVEQYNADACGSGKPQLSLVVMPNGMRLVADF